MRLFYQSLDETMPWIGQVARTVVLGFFGLIMMLFCFLIMSLFWCLGGVFFYALPILIILEVAELLTKKPFRYGYMGLATCSMITGMGYLYYLGFINFIYRFYYQKIEPWDAVEQVWSHFPRLFSVLCSSGLYSGWWHDMDANTDNQRKLLERSREIHHWCSETHAILH